MTCVIAETYSSKPASGSVIGKSTDSASRPVAMRIGETRCQYHPLPPAPGISTNVVKLSPLARRQRPLVEVAELVRVGDGPDRDDLATGDVERDDEHRPRRAIEEHSTRLTVDLSHPPLDRAERFGPIVAEEPDDPFPPVHRARESRAFAAAVGVEDDVGREQIHKPAHRAGAGRFEETPRQFVASGPGSLESGP